MDSFVCPVSIFTRNDNCIQEVKKTGSSSGRKMMQLSTVMLKIKTSQKLHLLRVLVWVEGHMDVRAGFYTRKKHELINSTCGAIEDC